MNFQITAQILKLPKLNYEKEKLKQYEMEILCKNKYRSKNQVFEESIHKLLIFNKEAEKILRYRKIGDFIDVKGSMQIEKGYAGKETVLRVENVNLLFWSKIEERAAKENNISLGSSFENDDLPF